MPKAFAFVAALFVAACARGGAKDVAADPLFGKRDIALAELAWTAPTADRVDLLLEIPGECLRAPADNEAAFLVEVGRAAFRSPLLFGGEAARSGLSCQSCHRNGHDNEAFFLKGLSGAPGTADVTSSLFSKTREDGRFNPIGIPTLVGVADKAAFGTAMPAPSLHHFIESAVREEFQGAAMSEAVVNGLAAYVSHLDAAACVAPRAPRTAGRDMADATRTVRAARAALAREDGATADFLIVSARQALGRVHDRFPSPDFERQRNVLVALSRRLGEARFAAGRGSDDAATRLEEIERDMAKSGAALDDSRAGSLYDRHALKAALAATSATP